jgi:hypothetical protein
MLYGRSPVIVNDMSPGQTQKVGPVAQYLLPFYMSRPVGSNSVPACLDHRQCPKAVYGQA